MQLLAVGAEGPLIGFAARVGTVPVTKALGLPVPCRGRRQRGVREKIVDMWEGRVPGIVSLLAPGWYRCSGYLWS